MTGAHWKTSSGLIAALFVHLLAPAALASAQFDHLIVALQTQQGYDKGVLDPLQLYAEVPQADPQALRVALNEPELYSGFALALACPHSPRSFAARSPVLWYSPFTAHSASSRSRSDQSPSS